MPDTQELEIAQILKEHHGVLVRTKRHNVYKFPDGRMFTTSCTPSDFRAANNSRGTMSR